MEPPASLETFRAAAGTPETPTSGARVEFAGGLLAVHFAGRDPLPGLELWVQACAASDHLITLTEGVLVDEQRSERESVLLPDAGAVSAGGEQRFELATSSGRRVVLRVAIPAARELLIELEAGGEPLRIGASWALGTCEFLTGTGARHGLRFDQTGRTIALGADRRYTGPDCPPDMLDIGGVPMGDYVPVPWVVSNRGWAAWVDCGGPGVELDLSADISLSVRSASGPLRLRLFGDPTPAALLRRYCRHTGLPQLLPEWAYGHWKSRDVYSHADDVIEDFEGYREHRLPLDAIVIDSPWETQYNTWEFNPWQFPDPEGLIARMRADGVRTVVWTTPWVNVDSTDGQRPPDPESERTHVRPASNYVAGEQAGHYVRNADGSVHLGKWWMGTGSPIDFTSPAARRWWIEQARSVLALGVEGIKADDGEGYYLDADLRFADGRRGAEAAWEYPRMYREAMQEALEAEHPGSGVLFARSGWSGAQSPGVVWGGDQVSDFWSLRSLVTATLTAAMSGISNWSHDVGGYLGRRLSERCPAELFIRWAQFGCFTPLMQAHARFEQEAWRYGHDELQIFRETVLLHERLVPYIRAAAATAARCGLPIIRPLPLVDPGDERGWTLSDAYMFGPSLWVAPVLEEDSEQRLTYLPRGTWIDFWTGARAEGGREVVVPAPLERIPVWVRAGSIVTTHPAFSVASGLGDEDPTRPLEATIWGSPPTGSSKVRLADGTAVGWRRGRWSVEDAPAGAEGREISFAARTLEPPFGRRGAAAERPPKR